MSWIVVVSKVVEPPMDVVRTTVLSKTEVDTPVCVCVAGVAEVFTFRLPVGTKPLLL